MAEKKQPIRLPKGTLPTHLNEKVSAEIALGLKYRKRRESAFNENYTLYRDKVRTNRLTQRQPMNIPLMKETIQTIGTKTNSPLHIEWENRDGDIDQEITLSALFREASKTGLLDLKTRVDKKNCYLYGRGHMGLEVDMEADIPVTFIVEDPYDIVVDPATKPYDIETARFITRDNIFKPLHEVLRNTRFDKDAREKVRMEYSRGSNKSNEANYQRKQERMREMGLEDIQTTQGLDSMVALQYHTTFVWDAGIKEYVKYYIVRADGKHILRAAPYRDVFGVDFYLLETWATDLESTDYWSDSIADIIRMPNKAINTWISQYLENRTMRGYGMNFYDATIEGFTPQQFQPQPFGWYPLPGKPSDVYQNVEMPELSGTLEDIQFIIGIAERASATGALSKGAVEDVKRTLGEIEIAVNNAQERTNDIAPLYNTAYERLAKKWYQLMVANMGDKKIPLYKKSPEGILIGKQVGLEDIKSENGYEVTAIDKAQSILETTDEIIKLRAARESFPNNKAMLKAEQKRLMRLVDLTPQEAEEVEQEEIENAEAALEAINNPQIAPEAPGIPGNAPTPGIPVPTQAPSNAQPVTLQ